VLELAAARAADSAAFVSLRPSASWFIGVECSSSAEGKGVFVTTIDHQVHMHACALENMHACCMCMCMLHYIHIYTFYIQTENNGHADAHEHDRYRRDHPSRHAQGQLQQFRFVKRTSSRRGSGAFAT